jgi:hypothetical protein
MAPPIQFSSLAMNAKIHKPEWQRIEIWLLWGAIFATLLLFLASSTI